MDNPVEKPWFVQSKFRLFLSLLLILTIPTLALTFLVTGYVRHQIEEQAIQQNTAIAKIVSKSVGEQFESLRQQVGDFSYRTKLIEATAAKDGKGLRTKLSEFLRVNPLFTRAFVTDHSGVMLTDWPFSQAVIGRDLSERDWFIGAKASGGPYVSEVYRRTGDKADLVTVCTPIFDEEKKVLGYFAGQLTADRLAKWFENVRPARNGSINLLDNNGRTLNGEVNPAFAGQRSFINSRTNREGWVFTNAAPGAGKNLYSFASIPGSKWSVVAEQPLVHIFAPVDTLMRTIALFFALCLVVAMLLAFYWFRTVSAYEALRERNQQTLQDYATRLKSSNQELESMCYSIAHDLRAPLRSMRGFALALKEDYGETIDECGRDFVDRIGESAQRMDELTQDLLDYGRLSHIEFEIRPIDLNLSINKILMTLGAELDSKNACLEIIRPLPAVAGNESILEQIFGHLLSNALKFTKKDQAPRIKISAELQGEKARIKVEDNGIGIDEAYHKRIFGVFERLHHHAEVPGTGIGLAIVKRGVERLGGKIGVISKKGEGACFWIDLPVAPPIDKTK